MANVRSVGNPYEITNLTGVITEIPNTSNFIKGMNLFDKGFTHLTSVEFDKDTYSHSLMESINRSGGEPGTRSGPSTEKFALYLPYFHEKITVATSDWNGKVLPGTDREKTKSEEIFRRIVPVRTAMDETHEYMQWQALKGNCVTPNGDPVADMFTLFGLTRSNFQIDFDLSNNTDVARTIRQLRQSVQRGVKTGGVLDGDLMVAVDESFFNKLVANDSVLSLYKNWESSVRYQMALDEFKPWGITAMFSHAGVTFFTYNHTFVKKDGTTEDALATDEGYVIPRTRGNNILKSVYGGSRREGSLAGAEMHAFQWDDPKGFYTEIHYETAPMFYCEKPETLWRVYTST